MGQYYNLLEYKPYREPWGANGNNYQTFFGKFEGMEESIQINKVAGNSPRLGANYGHLEVVPGKTYLRFKGEKVPPGTQIPQYTSAPQQTQHAAPTQPTQVSGIVGDTIPGWFVPYGNMIKFIYDTMKSMEGMDTPDTPGVPHDPSEQPGTPVGAQQPEQIAGAPISPEEQASLNDMFNQS